MTTQVKIVFKNGAVVDVVVEKIEAELNGLNELKKLRYVNKEGELTPLYIDLNEIVGIFYKNEQEM